MEELKKKIKNNQPKFILEYTIDNSLEELSKRIGTVPKYVELNKQVANLKLPDL